MNHDVILLTLLTVVNGASFATFGIDKLKSKRVSWRIPEARLLLMAFLGPFGAFGGMLVFRHKTRKPKFLIVPAFLVVQILIFVFVYPQFVPNILNWIKGVPAL